VPGYSVPQIAPGAWLHCPLVAVPLPGVSCHFGDGMWVSKVV